MFSKQELRNLKIRRDTISTLEKIIKKVDAIKISKVNTIQEDEEQVNKIQWGKILNFQPIKVVVLCNNIKIENKIKKIKVKKLEN